MIDIKILKRLAVFGSPTARAAAIVILDEMSDGELLREFEKIIGGNPNGYRDYDS